MYERNPVPIGLAIFLGLFLFVYCVFSNYLLVFLCLFFVAKALSLLFVMAIVTFVAHRCYVIHYFLCCLSSPLLIILTLLLIIALLIMVAFVAHHHYTTCHDCCSFLPCLATKLNNSTTFTCHLVAYLSSACYSSYFPPLTFNVQVTCSCSIMEFARTIIFAFLKQEFFPFRLVFYFKNNVLIALKKHLNANHGFKCKEI